MITQQTIKQLSTKRQTSDTNIAREYCQHLFLSNLYPQENSDKVLFKGGTAIKFIFNSPRYSEDLDFDGNNLNIQQLENMFTSILIEVDRLNIEINIQESKATTGGYLGVAFFKFLNYEIPIKIEVSLRKTAAREQETVLLINDFIPDYNIAAVAQEQLIKGKASALLHRTKARDFYDFYFILRKNLLSPEAKKILPKILKKLESESVDFKGDLMRLLPKDHHRIIKNVQQTLEREIKRFI